MVVSSPLSVSIEGASVYSKMNPPWKVNQSAAPSNRPKTRGTRQAKEELLRKPRLRWVVCTVHEAPETRRGLPSFLR